MIKIILIALCILMFIGMLCLDFILSKKTDKADNDDSTDTNDKKSKK